MYIICLHMTIIPPIILPLPIIKPLQTLFVLNDEFCLSDRCARHVTKLNTHLCYTLLVLAQLD